MKNTIYNIICPYAAYTNKCNDGSNVIPRSLYDLHFTIETLCIHIHPLYTMYTCIQMYTKYIYYIS